MEVNNLIFLNYYYKQTSLRYYLLCIINVYSLSKEKSNNGIYGSVNFLQRFSVLTWGQIIFNCIKIIHSKVKIQTIYYCTPFCPTVHKIFIWLHYDQTNGRRIWSYKHTRFQLVAKWKYYTDRIQRMHCLKIYFI